MDHKRTQDLEEALDQEARNKVAPLRPLLDELVIMPLDKAREKLEATNDARQRMWGDQVSRVPILQGSADEVFCALLECIVADHAEQRVTSLAIERVAAPASDDEKEKLQRAREQMRSSLNDGMKDYYQKRLMKRMQKEKGKDKAKKASAVQEINVKLYFANQTFGPHRIIRVAQDAYCFMPCSAKHVH